MNDLIENIIARTGLPAEAVQPVIGAVLAHLGDVLPAPIAHQVAIFLGVHQEESGDTNTAATDAGGAEPGLGGLLGGLMGAMMFSIRSFISPPPLFFYARRPGTRAVSGVAWPFRFFLTRQLPRARGLWACWGLRGITVRKGYP